MWQHYAIPTSLHEALSLLAAQPGQARPVAGGTDLVVEIDRGLRDPAMLVDLTRIPGLDSITLDDDGFIRLGALVTHNQVVTSGLCVARALPLAQACLEVGAPQIRNRATLAGNLVTASPANDTITPLLALDAAVTLESLRGRRVVPLREFYRGVRRTVLEPDELLTEIRFLPLEPDERGVFLKLGLRRAQAIAVINLAVILALNDRGLVRQARMTLGSVAPTIIHARKAEVFLIGRELESEMIDEAARLAEQAASPIDDLRASAQYRRGMVASLVARALALLAGGEERQGWPARPVTLGAPPAAPATDQATGPTLAPAASLPADRPTTIADQDTAIELTVNGQALALPGAQGMTLLDALRDLAGLTGTKKGCAEGECGSCTVWLDGAAVMSCLTPAAQAQGAQVVTVEGLAQAGQLHPLQQAFIACGAVQCGYCTPGLIMAAAKLLAERPRPSAEEARQAIAGNLCRCTGYAKVIEAITSANAERR